MITIAVDPGLVTGVSILEEGWPSPDTEEIAGRQQFYKYFRDRMEFYDDREVEVIIETYHITQHTAKLSSQLDALYILGAVEITCWAYGRELSFQDPSMKAFSTDKKLKVLGWWNPSKGGHANDASRHLLRHLVCTRKDKALLERLKVIL